MFSRYLIGPVPAAFAQEHLAEPRAAGRCLAFNAEGNLDLKIGPTEGWDQIVSQLPAGWNPDLILLQLAYTTVPEGLWSAPVPIVGLAGDSNLLWHYYRASLGRCDHVLTDVVGVEALQRAGLSQARQANLYGCGRSYVEEPWPVVDRSIDILFAGNLHPAVQFERARWLGRVARLGDRYRVVIATGVFGESYRQLLARARIVFNRSIRSECNQRVFETAAAGALLFQEAGNREVGDYFRAGQECVVYDDATLEPLLQKYLEDEPKRAALAEAARQRVRGFSYVALLEQGLAGLELSRPTQRATLSPQASLRARAWQALSSSHGNDPTLIQDVTAHLEEFTGDAELHTALAVLMVLPGNLPPDQLKQAVHHLHRAATCRPDHPVAALNLAEGMARLGLNDLAIEGARRALVLLDRCSEASTDWLDTPHFPPRFDHFRVEWERAGFVNAGNTKAEAAAKRALLRWRLHSLLTEQTGDLVHYQEAALARPDLPCTRAALGCALVRAGRQHEAVSHLHLAVRDNPFDVRAARALFQVLLDTGDAQGAQTVARERVLLHQAAPGIVKREEWFTQPVSAATAEPEVKPNVVVQQTRPGKMRISLCMIVRNEEANLPVCLGSVIDLVDEVIVVDTGSTDRTREIAAHLGAKVFEFPWIDHFAVARNESMRHATGDWILWLDADDRLDETNRERLRTLLAGLEDDHAAYAMKCICLPDRAGQSATAVDHVRLFRNRPDVRWEFRVHEQILPSLRRSGAEIHWSAVEIYHSGYQDPALRRGKLQRDLRLLRLEEKDQPYHPFTLFNLGSVLQELGQRNEAIPLLRRSLERSDPRDSIVRKLYALLVSCHRGLHQPQAALAVCREGLTRCPDDAELLFVLSLLLRDEGDAAGAEAALLQLIGSEPGEYFASVDSGLRGHKARHNLAVLYRDQGRHAEAEILWQAALLEQPHFRLARLGLAELYLTQGRWEELEQALAFLVGNPDTALDGAVLRARALLARKEFAAAREVLDQVIAQYPREVLPRVILSYVWLQEGLNMEAAEQALRAVLTLAPYHLEAHRNLSVLLLNRQPAGTPPSLAVRYHQACSTPSDLNEHLPTLSRLARECRHVTLLGVGSLRAPLALLQAQSERLLCIGWNGASGLEELAGLAGRTAVVTQQTRSLEVELEETDLLVLDMLHEYAPLQKALHLHAGKVKRFLVIHDTTAFGEQGETPGRQGLWPAIEEFLAQETFRLAQRYDNNNGLTVLERK